MLAVTQLDGFASRTYGPIELNFIGVDSYQATANSHTFTAESIGPDSPDRIVVVCVGWNISTSTTLSSATIGGVAATIIGQCNGTTSGIAIIQAAVPTGTTADVVVNYAGSPLRGQIAVYNLLGALSATVNASNFPAGGGDASRTATFNVPAGGVALGYSEGGANVTWTNADEDFDASAGNSNLNQSGAHRVYAAAQVSLGLTAANCRCIGGCSWG
jgi:hypothetical protein